MKRANNRFNWLKPPRVYVLKQELYCHQQNTLFNLCSLVISGYHNLNICTLYCLKFVFCFCISFLELVLIEGTMPVKPVCPLLNGFCRSCHVLVVTKANVINGFFVLSQPIRAYSQAAWVKPYKNGTSNSKAFIYTAIQLAGKGKTDQANVKR